MYRAGIDVSKWQGEIDWQAVKDQGISWACARIGIGWSYTDPQWAANLEGAKAVGLPMGGYYVPAFKDYDIKIQDTIDNLKDGLEESNLKPDFLINDVEKFDANADRRWSREITYQVSKWMRAYIGGHTNHVWQYSSKSIWDNRIGDGELAINPEDGIPSFSSDYPLYVAHYRAVPGQHWTKYLNPGNMPSLPQAWTPSSNKYRGDYLGWRVWQVIDSALGFEGVQSNEIDIDLMKPEFFLELFGNGAPPPPPPPIPPPDDEDDPPPDPTDEEIIGYLKVWKPKA